MYWQALDSGKKSAAQNMQADYDFLMNLPSIRNPFIHFYNWQSNQSATYGYFSRPERFFSAESLQKYQIDLAQRPTGGGIIFHQCDLAFSLLIPAGHPSFSLSTSKNYQFINQQIGAVIARFLGINGKLQLLPKTQFFSKEELHRSFCMAKSTCYDVVIEGKKAAGGAQRRTRFGLLHQASISLTMPPEEILVDLFASQPQIIEKMAACSFCLLGEAASLQSIAVARQELRGLLVEQFNCGLYDDH